MITVKIQLSLFFLLLFFVLGLGGLDGLDGLCVIDDESNGSEYIR